MLIDSRKKHSIDRRIRSEWSALKCPDSVIRYRGAEELEMEQWLKGRSTFEVTDREWALNVESIFVTLSPYAQLYFLGGMLIHILNLVDAEPEELFLSFAFSTLTGELAKFGVRDSDCELLLELRAHLQCRKVVIDFGVLVYSALFSYEKRDVYSSVLEALSRESELVIREFGE